MHRPLLKPLAGTELAGLANGPTKLSPSLSICRRGESRAPTIALVRDPIHPIATMLVVHFIVESRAARAGSGLGLRFSRCDACHAVYRLRASASRCAASIRSIVLGSVEVLEMPPPGDLGPARLRGATIRLHLAEHLCEARGGTSGFGFALQRLSVSHDPALPRSHVLHAYRAAHRNRGVDVMALDQSFIAQGTQMFLVLLIAPAVDRHHAQGQGPPDAAPRAARLIQPLPRSLEAASARNWSSPAMPPGSSGPRPTYIFAFTWVAAALVPTFASGLMFNWAADVVALVALIGAARAASLRWRRWTSAQASAGSAPPAK